MKLKAFVENGTNQRVLLFLGYGLFLVTFGGGPLGFTSGSSGQTVPWFYILFVQTAFFMGTVLGCLGIKFVLHQESLEQKQLIGGLTYAGATLLCLAAQVLLAAVDVQTSVIARCVMSLLVGMFYAQPYLFWVEQLLGLSRTCGRFGFLALLIACYSLNPIVLVLASRIGGMPYVYSVVMTVCAILSALIQIALFRPLRQPSHQTDMDADAERYHLTAYSAPVLVCLGFAWGIAVAASLLVLENGWSTESVLSMAIAFGLILAMAAVMLPFHMRNGVRFGTFIRLAIVACGAILVSVPLLIQVTPSLLYPLCDLAMIVGEISLIVFTIDICCAEGKSPRGVFTVNYALFMSVSSASAIFFWLVHAMVGGQTAWWVTAIVPTWVTLAVIPFLPSRSSDAVAFTLEKLPESEGYQANISMQRERMTQRYGLTAGEAEVLDLLLQGMNREQIAEKTYLSPWTIKARISAIYRKCGIHSYKELVKLVSDRES